MSPPRPRRLWHYTCGDHGAIGIVHDGVIRPNTRAGYQPLVSAASGLRITALPVIWLADLDVQSADDARLLGLDLKTEFVTCCRVGYRFRVPATSGVWWPDWADAAVADGRLEAGQRWLLERDRAPDRWWVSEKEIRGPMLDERYQPPVLFMNPGGG